MVNMNGELMYSLDETAQIIELYIRHHKGAVVKIGNINNKELFEKAATIALAWYETVNNVQWNYTTSTTA